jgi:hypothetical protein
MDPGHLKGLIVVEGRKDGWNALGEERLSGTGRTDHEQVVSSGGRHLKSLAAAGKAPNDGKVGDEVVVGLHARIPLRLNCRGRPRFLALEGGTDLGQGRGRQHTDSGDESGFRRILGRQQHGACTGAA